MAVTGKGIRVAYTTASGADMSPKVLPGQSYHLKDHRNIHPTTQVLEYQVGIA